ncbi:hypothetical protein V5P93_003688 [Actinokineospora auranticolor]|uniref:hypothetical protein n=1 Tax=Actinokineospora auranticolor TaxID=155976 RepID=UPI0011B0F3B7|nr:hypothetical protein [Actinokineospora auranticolor]
MTLTVVAAIAVVPTTGLLAWALWLLFNAVVARRHGPDALNATPPIARAFRDTRGVPGPSDDEPCTFRHCRWGVLRFDHRMQARRSADHAEPPVHLDRRARPAADQQPRGRVG